MTKISEEMIEKAYEIYFTDDQDITPLLNMGMNEGSAKMTMTWFKKLFDGELYKRSGSEMQIEWILNKLYETYDFKRLALALESLKKYCEFYDEMPMIRVRQLIKEFEVKLDNSW